MLSPKTHNNEVSNDSGKFSSPSSINISESEEDIFDPGKEKNKSKQTKKRLGETGDGSETALPASPSTTYNLTNQSSLDVPERMSGNEGLQKQLIWMQKNMEMLKQENLSLERAVTGQPYTTYPNSSPYQPTKGIRNQKTSQNFSTGTSSSSFVISNYKVEMATLKAELSRINNQLEMCELGRKSFSERWLRNLETSLKHMTVSLKQLLEKKLLNPVEEVLTASLQSRLKVADERLKRNRREMLGTLSGIEESLILENSQYKMKEAEVRRSLKQRTDQLQAIKRKHQSLMEMFQKLKMKSSQNGIIDIKELLKKYSITELEGGETSGVEKTPAPDTVLNEITEENNKQVSLLIKEKSVLSSEVGEISDENHLNRLENDKLKKDLSELNSTWKLHMEQFKQNQSEVLQRVLEQVEELGKEAKDLCKCQHEALMVIKVLEETLDTQERLLTSTLSELDQLTSNPPETLQKPQTTSTSMQTETPQTETKTVKTPVQNKSFMAILDFMKLRSNDQNTQPDGANKTEELPSPMVDVQALQKKISKLEVDLEFAEKNLAFQKELSVKLQNQVSDYQDDLRKKVQVSEMAMNNEKDLQREVASYKIVLKELQEDLAEKDKELKLLQTDKGSVQRLLERDRIDVGQKEGDASNTADIDFIKQALQLDIMSSRNALENSLKENNRLKLSLDQAIREMATERDLTSSATYDKMMLQQQAYSAENERDKEIKEKERLSTENALLQFENQKLNSALQAKHNLDISSSSAADKALKSSVKKLTAELSHTKQQLEAKEKELAFLQDTLKFVLNNNSKDNQASTS